MKKADKIVKEMILPITGKLVNVTELAEITGMSRQAIQQKLKSKQLRPDYRDGKGHALWDYKSAQLYRFEHKKAVKKRKVVKVNAQ